MSDIKLKGHATLAGTVMDFLMLDTGQLDETEEFATSVRVALGTDALADPLEILPDPDSTDRRGWWGDFEAEPIWDGWPIGTRNWLLTRAKITESQSSEGATVERARIYTARAIQPFVDRRAATTMAIDAQRVGLERINVAVRIYRGPLLDIDLQYQLLWQVTSGVDIP